MTTAAATMRRRDFLAAGSGLVADDSRDPGRPLFISRGAHHRFHIASAPGNEDHNVFHSAHCTLSRGPDQDKAGIMLQRSRPLAGRLCGAGNYSKE